MPVTLSSFEHLKHRTKEEFAYAVLRTAIIRCELKPGEKLILDGLSAELGISPIPMRAALQHLQAEGLVDIVPHTGAVVSEISVDHIEQIFLLLEHLETTAFEVAARKATPADIARLQQIVAEMKSAADAGDSERWPELNHCFHAAVASVTNMKLLIEFTNRTLDSWDRLRRMYLNHIVSGRIPKAQADHEKMIKLLAQRDDTRLIKLVVRHNRSARRDYQKLVASLRQSTT